MAVVDDIDQGAFTKHIHIRTPRANIASVSEDKNTAQRRCLFTCRHNTAKSTRWRCCTTESLGRTPSSTSRRNAVSASSATLHYYDLIVIMWNRMNIYFNNIHQAAPMLHRQRFMASSASPDHMKTPVCLQYIVMSFAAETTESYRHLGTVFYKRARTLLQEHEFGVYFTTTEHWTVV